MTVFATGGRARTMDFQPGDVGYIQKCMVRRRVASENEEWQLVCANVFGLQWSQRPRAMMDIRSLSSS